MVIMTRWFIVLSRLIYTLFACALKIFLYYVGKLLTNLILFIFRPEKNINNPRYNIIVKILFQLCWWCTIIILTASLYAHFIALWELDISTLQNLLNPRTLYPDVLKGAYLQIIRKFVLLVGLFMIEISYSFKTAFITSYLILYWGLFLVYSWYLILKTSEPVYKSLMQISFIIIFLFNSFFFYKYYWCIIIIFDTYDPAIMQLKIDLSWTVWPKETVISFIPLQKPQVYLLCSTFSSIVFFSALYLYVNISIKKNYSILLNT